VPASLKKKILERTPGLIFETVFQGRQGLEHELVEG